MVDVTRIWRCSSLSEQQRICEFKSNEKSAYETYSFDCESSFSNSQRWLCTDNRRFFWINATENELIKKLTPPQEPLSPLEAGAVVLLVSNPIGWLILLASCESEELCFGYTPNCNGLAKNETYVDFEPGIVPQENEESYRNFFRYTERHLREMNPKLFQCYNGVKIVSLETINKLAGESAIAFYSGEENKLYLPPSLYAWAHEFCHHVSFMHERCTNSSDTQEWNELSCLANEETNPEECIVSNDNNKRFINVEEEFAETCAHVLSNPAGAMINYAINPYTFQQATYIARELGLPNSTIQELIQKLQPTTHVHAKGYSHFVPAAETSLWYEKRDESLRMHLYNNGAFGYLANEQRFVLVLPSYPFAAANIHSIPLPNGVNPLESFQTFFVNNQFYILQKDSLYETPIDDNPSPGWRLIKVDDENSFDEPGQLASFNGEITYFSYDARLQIDTAADNPVIKYEYPEALKKLLTEATDFRVFESHSETYLWIKNIPKTGEGYTSQLIRLIQKDGGLDFERILEIPATPSASTPFYYKGNWYIVDHVKNNYLTNSLNNQIKHFSMFFSSSPPILIKIENGGEKITPIEIRYPDDNPLSPLHLTSYLSTPNTFISDGEQILFMSKVSVPSDAKFSRQVSFVNFTLE